MGFIDSASTFLFLNRRISDMEYELSTIMHRKLATIRTVNDLSRTMTADVSANGYYAAGTLPGVLPGFGDPAALPAGVTVSPAPDANSAIEDQINDLLGLEKELDAQQKILELELEALKAERDAMKKIAQEHAKNDFKIG